MHIEEIVLTNFRCFGAVSERFTLSPALTALVGTNGSGKTAMMQALLRFFGISGEQRRIRRQDFHVPLDETEGPQQRSLSIEVILGFPELLTKSEEISSSIPEFFHQMAAEEDGTLKCRLRLEATWTDDGSLDGTTEIRMWAIRTLAATYTEEETTELSPMDRGRIQMIYVPAIRDAASQVTAFLKGRIWRAVSWSEELRSTIQEAAEGLNAAFVSEHAVKLIGNVFKKRWQEVHNAGTDAVPILRPLDANFHEFIRKVEVVFHPDESGQDRTLSALSDGQRSLFQLAMTAATLDIETTLLSGTKEGFQENSVTLPSLTLLAIEEPENNLAPFYLSRIIGQVQNLTSTARAQALVSSHSASILGRIEPQDVRYFRLDPKSRTASVKKITLPEGTEEAAKFVREAVRSYPELYFARFVILGEGSSEEVVLPLIAESLGLPIDRSFVAVVPLGGRHVNHFWKLLNDLNIPHATLLDLDYGRFGGGWGRIKTACEQLLMIGIKLNELFEDKKGNQKTLLATFDSADNQDRDGLKRWLSKLREYGIFFCAPLDLDMTMLNAFTTAYKQLETGMKGPAQADAGKIILGEEGNPDLYSHLKNEKNDWKDLFRWYRYLFLGRGKPSTHVRALSTVSQDELRENAPATLKRLISFVAEDLSETLTSGES
jgi:putative ATP-dependent endonuclease of OLD family